MTSHQILDMARNNNLLPDDLVRRNNSRWVLARSVLGLFDDSTLRKLAESPRPLASVLVPSDAVLPLEDDLEADEEPSDGTCEEEDSSPTKVIRALIAGSVLGNYTVLAKLGEGGMGTVLKAQHRKMDRIVALKVLHGDATRSPGAVKRFQMEVRAAARLIHPHIVTALDADEDNGIHFLVMEYVDGIVLSDLVAKSGPLPLRDAMIYTVQVAQGLAYAHSEGVVHRDIKPGNLLLDKRGNMKILDMGLARMERATAAIAGGTDSLTKAGQVLGTLDYLSPEQAEDAHKVDHRTDIYSLGCTFFRLLTGRPPYRGKSIVNKIVAHRDHPIPSLTKARAGAPHDMDAVFRMMVAKRPEHRFGSMKDVITDLEMFLSKGSVRSETLRASAALDANGSAGMVNLGKAKPLSDNQSVVYKPSGPVSDSDAFQLVPEADGQDDEATRPRFYLRVLMSDDQGPLSMAQLQKLKKRGKLTPDDMLRNRDESRWFPVTEVPGLF